MKMYAMSLQTSNYRWPKNDSKQYFFMVDRSLFDGCFPDAYRSVP